MSGQSATRRVNTISSPNLDLPRAASRGPEPRRARRRQAGLRPPDSPSVDLQLAGRHVSTGELVHAVVAAVVGGEDAQEQRAGLLIDGLLRLLLNFLLGNARLHRHLPSPARKTLALTSDPGREHENQASREDTLEVLYMTGSRAGCLPAQAH